MSIPNCPQCGHETAGGACPSCGRTLAGANGVPSGKLAPELAAWEGSVFDREAFLAGLREVERTGGVELKDFLHELEEGVAARD